MDKLSLYNLEHLIEAFILWPIYIHVAVGIAGIDRVKAPHKDRQTCAYHSPSSSWLCVMEISPLFFFWFHIFEEGSFEHFIQAGGECQLPPLASFIVLDCQGVFKCEFLLFWSWLCLVEFVWVLTFVQPVAGSCAGWCLLYGGDGIATTLSSHDLLWGYQYNVICLLSTKSNLCQSPLFHLYDMWKLIIPATFRDNC